MKRFFLSWAFFTRLPIPRKTSLEDLTLGESILFFPVIGAVIGLATGAFYMLCATAFTPSLAVWLALLFQLWLTGALHEDGLADMVDALAGGNNPETRLSLMKDSRVGSFGALALIMSVGLRATAMMHFEHAFHLVMVLMVAGAVSRTTVAWMMYALPPAKEEGLAYIAGRPDNHQFYESVGVMLLIVFFGSLLIGKFMLLLVSVAAGVLSLMFMANYVREKFGGTTGDILGAQQQVCEILILCSIAALAARS